MDFPASINTSPVVVLNDKRPTFQFSTEPQNDLDIKLHMFLVMQLSTDLHMFLTLQLCMCFMERQERKIHRVTMIKCSTMLLAGLLNYWQQQQQQQQQFIYPINLLVEWLLVVRIFSANITFND